MPYPYGNTPAPQLPQPFGMQGGFGNFLGNNSNTLLSLGTGMLNSYFNPGMAPFDQGAIAYGMKSDREKRQENKTRKFLQSKFGMSPQDAEAAAGSPEMLNLLLADQKPKAPISVGKDETLLDPTTYEPIYQGAGVGQADQTESFDMEQKLRKEWAGRQETQNFNDVLAGYERLRTAAEQGTGPGDVGVVIGYMKMLDPGSVVREGEYATVRNASGVPEQIRSLYNRMIEGDQLSPEMRQQIVASATALYEDAAKRQSSLGEDFSGIADQYNVDPSRVVRPVPQFPPLKLNSGGTLTPNAPGSFIWSPQ